MFHFFMVLKTPVTCIAFLLHFSMFSHICLANLHDAITELWCNEVFTFRRYDILGTRKCSFARTIIDAMLQ